MNRPALDALEAAMLQNWDRDGHLAHVIFGLDDATLLGVGIAMNTGEARDIAEQLVTKGADTVAHVAEAWTAEVKRLEDLKPPSQMPMDDRGEVIALAAASRDGQWWTVKYQIDRATRQLGPREIRTEPPTHDRVLSGLWEDIA